MFANGSIDAGVKNDLKSPTLTSLRVILL